MSNLPHGSILIMENSGKNIDGKKFTTWEVNNPLANKRVEILVTFHNKEHNLYFIAHIPTYKTRIQNSDINKLKDDAHQFVNNKINLESNIEWEDWIEVKVFKNFDKKKKETNFQIDIKISNISKGFDDNKPGEEFTINSNNFIVPFPKSGKHLEIENIILKGNDGEEKKFKCGEPPHSVTFLKDTPENRTGLEQFLNELNKFTDKLQEFILEDSFHEKIMNIHKSHSLLK